MASGWRSLGVAWAAVLLVAGAGAGALQAMGPKAVPAAAAGPAPAAAPSALPAPRDPPLAAPPRVVSGSVIPAPDPALLEPAPDYPGAMLPRAAVDGRTSMLWYARPADPAERRPRVAMLVVGLGQDTAASRNAADTLPAAISLGISPYGHDLDALLDDVRARGHEFLVTIPMESQGYPLNGSGPQALMTGADPADNNRRLEWILSRMQGEVGVTAASDGLRGERFAASPGSIGPVQREVARRGLLYVDPRPHAPVPPSAVAVTAVVDDLAERAEIDTQLAALEQAARTGGPAIGLALRPRPATVERIAVWARGLDGRGVALVPVSSLVPGR